MNPRSPESDEEITTKSEYNIEEGEGEPGPLDEDSNGSPTPEPAKPSSSFWMRDDWTVEEKQKVREARDKVADGCARLGVGCVGGSVAVAGPTVGAALGATALVTGIFTATVGATAVVFGLAACTKIYQGVMTWWELASAHEASFAAQQAAAAAPPQQLVTAVSGDSALERAGNGVANMSRLLRDMQAEGAAFNRDKGKDVISKP